MDGYTIERDQLAIETKHEESFGGDGGRFIGKASELPAWFLEQDFGFLKAASTQMWCNVLGYLLNLQALLKPGDSAEALDAFDALLSTPIIEVARDIGESYRYKTDPGAFRFRSVAAVTNLDVAQFAHGAKSWPLMAELQKALRKRRPFLDPQTALHDFARAPHFKSVEENGSDMRLVPRRAITVNMTLPDQVLIEDFKRWLDASRELPYQSYRAPKPLRKVDLDEWADKAFAQYSLIQFWKQRERVRVTKPLLLEVLYASNRRITEDMIRRTIHPNWEAWLTRETHYALQALASGDT